MVAQALDRWFQLRARGTDVRTELLAGVSTFLTMSYVVLVHPKILADAGMDPGAVFVATCLASALGSLLMGLWANLPIGLAPGMGLNAWFAYTVCGAMGYSWQTALGAVFLSGLGFWALGLLGVRRALIEAMPVPLQHGVSAGIGLFLALIGLKSAGVVVASPATLVALGDVSRPGALLAGLGFLLTLALAGRGWTSAVLVGVLSTTALSVALGVSGFSGVVAAPPSVWPVLGQLDVRGALDHGLVSVVLTFLFVDLFDNSGTLVGVAHAGGLVGRDGQIPGLDRAMQVDAVSAAAGAVLGTSTTTSYIESVAGIAAGGRTGLVAVTVAACFLLALFFSPLAATVPPHATAGALLFVAVLMARGLAKLPWEDPVQAGPALVAALTMPFTFSIAHGLSLGVLAWVGAHTLAGRWRELPPALVAVAALCAARLGWLSGG